MPLGRGILRTDLRAIAVTTLIAAGTTAQTRVHAPEDWPETPAEFPALLVQTPVERKKGLGTPLPQFDVTITLVVLARVIGASAALAQVAIDGLCAQVEQALLCAPAMLTQVESFTEVDTSMVVDSQGGQHIGEAAISFGCKLYQRFDPDAGPAITEIVTTIPASDTTPALVIDSKPPA